MRTLLLKSLSCSALAAANLIFGATGALGADEWPQFRDRKRPAFLQTLPHVHGTSGFFIARLRV